LSNIKASEIKHDLFIANILLVGLIIVLTLITYHFFPARLESLDVLLPQFLDGVQPKPVERTIFFICAVTLPLFSLGYVTLHQTKPCSQHNKSVNALNAIAPLFLGILFFSSLFRSDWIQFIFNGFLSSNNHKSVWILGFFSISLILSILLCRVNFKQHGLSNSHYQNINWIFFICASVLIVFAWRVTSIYSADHSFRSVHHLDAVLYSLSQVVQGKTILVDLPSQYGLFPELLAPFFKIIGLSVFKFSLLMAMLQITALIALFYVLTRLIKSQTIIFLGGITLIVLTTENVFYLAGFPDPYYQYWPIRFFFPAISASLFYWFCKNKSIKKSLVISLVSSVAILWNLDTGIFIFISYGAYLCVSYLFYLMSYPSYNKFKLEWNKKDFLAALAAHILILIITIFLFGLFLRISSGQPLNYTHRH